MSPAKFAQFTHSGNYLLAVTNDEGDTLLTRRFWVTEEAIKVEAEVTRPYDGMDLLKRQEVDVRIENRESRIESFSASQLRPEWERVRVVQVAGILWLRGKSIVLPIPSLQCILRGQYFPIFRLQQPLLANV